MKVLFIRILLCKSRKQFWQPCHMKFVNSPISFRLNKKVGLKLQFFEKSTKVALDTQNATRPRDFCQNSVKNGSTIVSEKDILFSQNSSGHAQHNFDNLDGAFGTKSENESEFMIFSQKNVIWFKIFFCKPKNSKQLHTFAKVFLWRVRKFVAHSAKMRLKLCFLEKITLRHSPKMILNL